MLVLLPQLGHILQRLTLRLRNEAPYEQGGNHADDAIQTISEPVTEVVALCQMHVEHRHKR